MFHHTKWDVWRVQCQRKGRTLQAGRLGWGWGCHLMWWRGRTLFGRLEAFFFFNIVINCSNCILLIIQEVFLFQKPLLMNKFQINDFIKNYPIFLILFFPNGSQFSLEIIHQKNVNSQRIFLVNDVVVLSGQNAEANPDRSFGIVMRNDRQHKTWAISCFFFRCKRSDKKNHQWLHSTSSEQSEWTDHLANVFWHSGPRHPHHCVLARRAALGLGWVWVGVGVGGGGGCGLGWVCVMCRLGCESVVVRHYMREGGRDVGGWVDRGMTVFMFFVLTCFDIGILFSVGRSPWDSSYRDELMYDCPFFDDHTITLIIPQTFRFLFLPSKHPKTATLTHLQRQYHTKRRLWVRPS